MIKYKLLLSAIIAITTNCYAEAELKNESIEPKEVSREMSVEEQEKSNYSQYIQDLVNSQLAYKDILNSYENCFLESANQQNLDKLPIHDNEVVSDAVY